MTENTQLSKNRRRVRFVVYNGIIAALYVVLTLPFAQIAYGPLQVRLAEVMTVLPAFSLLTVPGVTLGCFLANLFNPNNLGPIDIIFGTLATLIAGFLSYPIAKPNKMLGIIPPVVVNGLIVGGYLPFLLTDSASSVTAAMVGISMLEVAGSEAALLVILGLPLILLIKKTKLEEKL